MRPEHLADLDPHLLPLTQNQGPTRLYPNDKERQSGKCFLWGPGNECFLEGSGDHAAGGRSSSAGKQQVLCSLHMRNTRQEVVIGERARV